MSGDKVWTAVPQGAAIDGFSGATLLAQMRVMTEPFAAQGHSWWNAFVGLEPGSMGETSAAACLIGAAILHLPRQLLLIALQQRSGWIDARGCEHPPRLLYAARTAVYTARFR